MQGLSAQCFPTSSICFALTSFLYSRLFLLFLYSQRLGGYTKCCYIYMSREGDIDTLPHQPRQVSSLYHGVLGVK